MPDSPTLAVLVPNFNHAHYLPRCLDSIVQQSRPPDEIVLLDDASTDNSLEVMYDYARRYPFIKVHRHEHNQGVLAAGLKLNSLATADFSCGVASDDYVRAGYFQAALELLERHPGAHILFSDLAKVDRAGRVIEESRLGGPARYVPPAELASRMARTGFPIMGVHSMVRTQTFHEPGLYVTDLLWVMDWLFSSVVAFRYGIVYLPGTYKCMEIRRDSYHHTGHRGDQRRQVVRMALAELEKPEFSDVRDLIRRSGNFELLGTVGLELLLFEPRYRRYLTWPHLRRQFAPWLRERLARSLPWLRNLYRRLLPNPYEI